MRMDAIHQMDLCAQATHISRHVQPLRDNCEQHLSVIARTLRRLSGAPEVGLFARSACAMAFWSGCGRLLARGLLKLPSAPPTRIASAQYGVRMALVGISITERAVLTAKQGKKIPIADDERSIQRLLPLPRSAAIPLNCVAQDTQEGSCSAPAECTTAFPEGPTP